jgi:hypothetical protein
VEEAMQKAMDGLAGGRTAGYRYSLAGLREARREIRGLYRLSLGLRADGPRGLSRAFELRERLVLSESLITHLMNRRETRWPGFGEYVDHPGLDPRYELFLNSLGGGSLGLYPTDGLKGVGLLARGLGGEGAVPLPDPQLDPPDGWPGPAPGPAGPSDGWPL